MDEIDRPKHDHLETPPDVAARLQVKLPRVYEAVRDGRLRAVRVGRLLRFRPEDVQAFLQRNETRGWRVLR